MPVHRREFRFLGFSFPAPNLPRARFPHGILVRQALQFKMHGPKLLLWDLFVGYETSRALRVGLEIFRQFLCPMSPKRPNSFIGGHPLNTPSHRLSTSTHGNVLSLAPIMRLVQILQPLLVFRRCQRRILFLFLFRLRQQPPFHALLFPLAIPIAQDLKVREEEDGELDELFADVYQAVPV